ncbi:glycosyltransferase family 2 protein [Gluconobacter oxydans]|uniref:Glycosyltransferase family 2 protein n=1 Tax=Gluconobacter oxydans TaxID=442 RepID=A0AB35ARZ4_GLUOY|nr:glycosyltransferase [Gluconobacter oxydans]MBF0857494.1 glycosyltransferase family 2 protein [Gluconobacter oxydans]TCW19449.1 GT2 family glycosyltransferase [Gluconobacter oxydans]
MTESASQNTPTPSADVAIVMRTKNRLLLLPRALGSVLLQKFTRWHLYLVNDGGDREALEALLATYRPVFGSRLTVIHHAQSQGMEAASNAALAAGTEEFVVVHDDDDSWDPNFLLNTVLFLSDPKNDRYLGVATSCYVIGEIIEEDGSVRETDKHVWTRESGATDYVKMLSSNTFPPICFLFRRSVIEKIGPFNATLPVLGDWDFNIRLMSCGDIGHIATPLANYYHRKTGKNSVYSNSVIGGASSHVLNNILLRNKTLRNLLDKQPEMLGLFMALLPPLHETKETAGRLEYEVSEARYHLKYLEDLIKNNAGRLEYEVSEARYHLKYLEDLIKNNAGRLDRIESRISATDQRIQPQIDQIQMVSRWHWKMLRPLHKVWRVALPFRRVVAYIRGRS